MEVFLKILESHFIFVDFGILETIFYFVKIDVLLDCLEHPHDVLRHEVSLLLLV